MTISINSNETVEASEIAIVAEVTTPLGPEFEDHFLFLILRDARLIEIVLGTPAAYQLITELESALGCKLETQLAHIPDHASLILYPKQLAGKALYDYRTIYGKRGWLEKITGGGSCLVEEYTPEVQELLAALKK